MTNEREETYAALRQEKDRLECWLAARQWPVNPEISLALDRLLVLIEQGEANGDIR
ncbi:MAG: hypothetical protein KC587_17840 [Nitrospira sp.]|nr:hypothetical protein [Nitrospira sp.]